MEYYLNLINEGLLTCIIFHMLRNLNKLCIKHQLYVNLKKKSVHSNKKYATSQLSLSLRHVGSAGGRDTAF